MYPLEFELGEKIVYLITDDYKIPGLYYNEDEKKEVYVFGNLESEPYKSSYDVIKDLVITKIPNKVEIYIIFGEENEYGKEFMGIPYPFSAIQLTKNNDTCKILLTSCTAENWVMRWSRETFFDEFIAISKNGYEGLDVIVEDWREYDDGRISLEFEAKESSTINDALKHISRVSREFIDEVNISLSGLAKLQEILNIWKENKDNFSEEFWQNTLMKYSWIIGQVFSLPLIIFQDKAYMGGKDIRNKNGEVIDFVYKNKFTSNIALIEIKTPESPLIGTKYRKTYSISNELSGAINQVLLYKDSCQKDFASLVRRTKEVYEPFNPKCLLIVGKVCSLDEEKKIAFELFRNELKSVEIITFDELFEKVKILLDLSRNNI